MGSAYQSMKDYLKAADFQEQHLALAKKHANTPQDETQLELAYNQLKVTYTAYGELMEAEGNVDSAIEYHRKCLQASEQTVDKAAEASAHYRLGRALVLSDANDHIDQGRIHLMKSLELCK